MEKFIKIEVIKNKIYVQDNGFSASESISMLRTVANFLEDNLKKNYIYYKNKKIEDFPFNYKTKKAFISNGITTIENLNMFKKRELLKLKFIGKKTVAHIAEVLKWKLNFDMQD